MMIVQKLKNWWESLDRVGRWRVIRLCLLAVVGGWLLVGLLVWLVWRPLVWHLTPDVKAQVAEAIARGRGGAFLDRNGVVLRYFPNSQGDYLIWSPLAECSPSLVQAVLTAEDRNFFTHPGFDLSAILRAAWQNLTERRIVSGASTISQQVIRIIRPRPRTLLTKASELVLAAKLEMQAPKDSILEAWLNLAPMYGNVRGVGMASRLLFHKSPGTLTLAEAATLAAFPQSPARMNPESARGRRNLRTRRDWILGQMGVLGRAPRDEVQANLQDPMNLHLRKLPFRAPHFVDWLVQKQGIPQGEVTTSLDMQIQDRLVTILDSHRGRLLRSGAHQAAGLILDTATLQVLAMAGSFEYGPVGGGFNNGCLAARSGGSTLKPFLYALALEQGFHAGSIIPDTNRTFRTPQGDYLPYNATRQAYGPVSIRSALGNSLNISAVKMLNELGIREFFRFLVDLGMLAPSETMGEFFGLGLAIGNPEIRMVDVAAAYASLGHGGRQVSLRTTPGELVAGRQLLSPGSAWVILDILADPSARLLTFGNPRFFSFEEPVALKTGTSTNYRDSWLYAVTPAFTVGLWAGNFDGRPTQELSGGTACGPILNELWRELRPGTVAWFPRPAGLVSTPVCGFSGMAPAAFCPVQSREWVERSRLPLSPCSFHERQGTFHELPVEYAEWIQSRGREIRVDPFSLQGQVALADPLGGVTGDPFSDPGVRWVGPTSGAAPLPLPTGTMAGGIASPPARMVLRADTPEGESPWGRLRIVSPHNGDRFVMVPDRENLARLRAVPEVPLPEVVWLVDGNEVSRTGPPYEAFWPLQPGRHVITALSMGEEAAQVIIEVE